MNGTAFLSGLLVASTIGGGVWLMDKMDSNYEIARLSAQSAVLQQQVNESNSIVLHRLTIGIRNNNPMNIKGKLWNGQTDVDEFGHAVFSSVHYGLRAGARALINMQRLRGCKTITQYIARYCEKNREAYIHALSDAMGIAPDEEFNIYDHLMVMMKTIVKQENGYNPYPDSYFIPYSFIAELTD